MSSAASPEKEICKAPDRTVPMGKANPIVFHIHVDRKSKKAVVSLTPSIVMLIPGDYVKFTSNSAATAIRYTEYSPFKKPADAGDTFPVGKSSKVLPVARPHGSSHFDCGYIEKKTRKFEAWPGNGGDGPGGY